MTSYYLRGPVVSDFLIYGIDSENNQYFLSTTGGTNLTFVNYNTPVSTSSPLTFSFKSDSLGFAIVNNGIQFVNQGLNSVAVLSPDPDFFSLVPIDYAEVSGYTAIVGQYYNLKTPSWADVVFNYTNSVSTLSGMLSRIRFVPLTWYPENNCLSANTGLSVVQPIETSWITNPSATISKGFTLPNQCSIGVFYDYCSLDSPTCGPCLGSCGLKSTCRENPFGIRNDFLNLFVCDSKDIIIPTVNRTVAAVTLLVIFVIIVFIIIVVLI